MLIMSSLLKDRMKKGMDASEPTVFAIGDALQLKTGGPSMTAGPLDPKKGRRCVWSVKSAVKEKFFPDEMLRPFEDEKIAAIRVQIVDPHEPKFRAALETIAAGCEDPQAVASDVLRKADDDPGRDMPKRASPTA
jgi:uncharacterized protein YodC (DUF2158 family)